MSKHREPSPPPSSSWESVSWKTSPLCSGALRFLPLSARGARARAAGQRMEQRGGAAKFAGYRSNSSSPDAPRDLHGSRKKNIGAGKQKELPQQKAVSGHPETPDREQPWTRCWPGPARRGGVPRRAEEVRGKCIRAIPSCVTRGVTDGISLTVNQPGSSGSLRSGGFRSSMEM